MSLISLPTELLYMILEELGPETFQEDINRLLVCKAWYRLALPICYQRVCLTSRNLDQVSRVAAAYDVIIDNVKSVVLSLSGCDDWPPADGSSLSAFELSPAETDAASRWFGKVECALENVVEMLEEADKLEKLQFTALSQLNVARLPFPPPQDYLYGPTIYQLLDTSLSHERLTVLELDTGGSALKQSWDTYEEVHLCPLIASSFTHLRRLRLRMWRICPDVIKVLTSGIASLEVVVINISLKHPLRMDCRSWLWWSHCCGAEVHYWDHEYWPDPFMDSNEAYPTMVEAATQAKPALPKLRFLRVLSHIPAHKGLVAVDCLSGTNLMLPEGADWEDDGSVDTDNRGLYITRGVRQRWEG
ncbi:MAG: hypothetical protein M1825_001200 [Sarcosagium campestre]|nr:MAG: hypothetical protein M1825_001200 [Sarcosagium campestre]